MLREAQLETQSLRSQIADLNASTHELRAAEAAFAYELSRAFRIHGTDRTQLMQRLATGHVTAAIVARLSNNETFQQLIKTATDIPQSKAAGRGQFAAHCNIFRLESSAVDASQIERAKFGSKTFTSINDATQSMPQYRDIYQALPAFQCKLCE